MGNSQTAQQASIVKAVGVKKPLMLSGFGDGKSVRGYEQEYHEQGQRPRPAEHQPDKGEENQINHNHGPQR